MAAYNYLSNLSILKGAPFLVFSDLGAPDALFSVGGFAVNVLPVAMTLLNCVSTFIYTRGLGLRDKLQAYGLALVFLVLLYDSPSGLVMYWTCNQVFSVCKNIVFKRGADANSGARFAQEAETWSPTPTFLLATLLIVALGGVLIPSALISSSAKEFINEMEFVNPLRYVGYVATVLCGFFLLWVGVFFYLSKRRGRERFALVLTVLAVVFLVDYFFFGKNLGIITSSLIFENEPQYSPQTLAVNTTVVLLIPVAVWLLWRYQRQIINPVLGIAMVATLVMAFPNLSVINQAAKDTQANLQEVMAEAEREEEAEAAQEAASKEEGEATPTVAAADASYVDTFYNEDGSVKQLITLSREGKNVVVLFMDRAIGAYVPYLINEKPELKELLDGFTFYPNTISFGHYTVFGSPALYGGYDYTVEAMNARSDKLLRDKHDEALQVMPALFSQNGYDVTLFNPPLVGYHYYSNEYTLYDSYQNVDAYNVTWAYANRYFSEYASINKQNFKRNMCFYSLFKMVPVALQGPLYDGGVYFSTAVNHTVDEAFIENYAVVASLKDLVTIDEGASDHLFIMGNCMTHNPDLLQMPNYTPSLYVDNSAYEDPSRFVLDGQEMDVSTDRLLMHYHANMAALLRLGEWFDYLREQGVYDNTRIIIVADHGAEFEQFSNMVFDDGAMNVEAVNPLFMVKDFNAQRLGDKYMKNLKKGHWDLLYDEKTYVQSAPKNQRWEASLDGSLKQSPWGMTITFDMARAAVEGEQLGHNPAGVPDMLCVSISSTDMIGHQLSPNSIWMEDLYLRLDRDLEQFFNYLDEHVGRGQWLFFLTADHAGFHNTDFMHQHRLPADTWFSATLADDINAHVCKALSLGEKPVERIRSMQVHFTAATKQSPRYAEILEATCRYLESLPQVAYAFPTEAVPQRVPEPVRTMAVNGYCLGGGSERGGVGGCGTVRRRQPDSRRRARDVQRGPAARRDGRRAADERHAGAVGGFGWRDVVVRPRRYRAGREDLRRRAVGELKDHLAAASRGPVGDVFRPQDGAGAD